MTTVSFGTINYKVIIAPESYVCDCCGAKNVKLWRQYNTFLDHIKLLCATCAAHDQQIDISTITSKGLYISDITQAPTDSIGWLVPAVPTEDGDSFWGYTSVPPEGCLWWQSLPTFKR